MYIYEEEYFYKSIVKKEKEDVFTAWIQRDMSYDTFFIAKKNGERQISAIKRDSVLYEVQKNLKEYFLKFPVSAATKGFIPGESYFEFLKPHINKKFYIRIDIKDFFGSIPMTSIQEELSRGCKVKPILQLIVYLCTLDDKLPQGAVTSPVLSNIAFSKVDQRIIKYCQSLLTLQKNGEKRANDIVYTRYADDLLFSSDEFDFKNSKYFLYMIKKILRENGYLVNPEKLKYGYGKIVLSGFVVGEDIHLSRKKCKQLNTILFYFDKRANGKMRRPYSVDASKVMDSNLINNLNTLAVLDENEKSLNFQTVNDLINYLCGYRSFLISVVRNNQNIAQQKGGHIEQIANKIDKIQKVVDSLAKHYEK